MLHFVFILIACFIIAALVEAIGWKTALQIAFLLILGSTVIFLIWLAGMGFLAWITWEFAVSILGIFGVL
jgi:hypothetical protein